MRLQLELRDRFAARQDVMGLRRRELMADKAERARVAPLKPQPRAQMQELRRRVVIRLRPVSVVWSVPSAPVGV